MTSLFNIIDFLCKQQRHIGSHKAYRYILYINIYYNNMFCNWSMWLTDLRCDIV